MNKKKLIISISSIAAVILAVILILVGVKSCKKTDKTNNGESTPVPQIHGKVIYHTAEKNGENNLWLYDFDKDTLECVTKGLSDISDCKYADFNNDGSAIAFMAKDKNGSYDVYTLNLSDKILTNITDSYGGGGFPAFSPDGKKIAYTRTEGDSRLIYEYDLTSGELRCLSDIAGFYSDPCYSDDGNYIYFASGTNDEHNRIMRAGIASLERAAVYSEENISCTKPCVFGDDFYFTKQFNATSANTAVVKYDSASGQVRDFNFNSLYYNVTDAAPINENYLLLSSDKDSGNGTYKLFVADCNKGTLWSLDSFNSKIKSAGDIFGADYFISDISSYNLEVSDIKVNVKSKEGKTEEKKGENPEISMGDTITCSVEASSGYGEYDYSYYILKDGIIYSQMVRSFSPQITFTPKNTGTYTLKIYIEDETNQMSVRSFEFTVK